MPPTTSTAIGEPGTPCLGSLIEDSPIFPCVPSTGETQHQSHPLLYVDFLEVWREFWEGPRA